MIRQILALPQLGMDLEVEDEKDYVDRILSEIGRSKAVASPWPGMSPRYAPGIFIRSASCTRKRRRRCAGSISTTCSFFAGSCSGQGRTSWKCAEEVPLHPGG